MKCLTISVIFSVQFALCHAQQFNIEVYDISESGLENEFNIRPFINYQKLAVGDDHLIVIVDSNVVFTEYDMRNGQRLFQKQLRTQLTDHYGNKITDICYQLNGDVSLSYEGALIFVYRKSKLEYGLNYRSNGAINKIRTDPSGIFTYHSTTYSDGGGSIDRHVIGSYDNIKKSWKYFPLEYQTDSVRLFTRLNPHGITDFDFNQRSVVFAFLNANNELTSFRGLRKQEAKALLKKSWKGVSWEHRNGLRASQPEHLNDRKISPMERIKAFQVVNGDSVMHVLESGDVFVRHYDTEALLDPIFNVGNSLLPSGFIYVDELDRYIWIYPNKVLYTVVSASGIMKILNEVLLENEIVDFKISTNERKLAVVTRNTVERASEDPVRIEIRTIGK